jgi:hypothetical protein
MCDRAVLSACLKSFVTANSGHRLYEEKGDRAEQCAEEEEGDRRTADCRSATSR